MYKGSKFCYLKKNSLKRVFSLKIIFFKHIRLEYCIVIYFTLHIIFISSQIITKNHRCKITLRILKTMYFTFK